MLKCVPRAKPRASVACAHAPVRTQTSCLRFPLTSLSFLVRVTLIKTNTVKCKVVNAASVSNLAINNATWGRPAGGANGVSQVILANQKPPQDVDQARGLLPVSASGGSQQGLWSVT